MQLDDVLSGRAGADGVRAALRSSPLRKSLRTSVSGVLAEAAPLGPCRLRRTKFKPGNKLTAWFDATAGAERVPRPIAVSWWVTDGACSDRTDDEAALEAEADRRGLRAPFRSLTTTVPHLGMRIAVAPLDASFPQLVRLSDPAYASLLMGHSTRPRVVAVRYRPGQRHVLRYQPAPGERGPVVFVKLYRDDAGARCERVAATVADLFDAEGGNHAAARPLGYLDREDRAVLLPFVAGVPLSAHLRRGTPSAGAHLRAAGAMLRRLHDAPPDVAGLVEPRDVEAELAATDRATAAIRRLSPATHVVVRDVLGRTRELLGGAPPERARFTHGDYKADHLLIGRSRITLIDFDRCARADPALDLAKFLADLRWWLGPQRQLRVVDAQQQFLRGYGKTSPGRLIRARLLEALQLVKLAARRVPVHEPDWERRTATLVDQADRLSRDLTREVVES